MERPNRQARRYVRLALDINNVKVIQGGYGDRRGPYALFET